MATFVFADTHLSEQFDPKLCSALEQRIVAADTTIILGDLWDWYRCSFDEFYNSEWSQLFPLIHKKKSYYVLGNHDRSEFMDERVKNISQWVGEAINLELDGVQIHCEHGDAIAPSKDHYFPRISKLTRGIYRRYYPMEVAVGRKAKWIGRAVNLTQWSVHLRMMRYVQAHTSEVMRLMGHSHIPTADPAHQYFNPGATGMGWLRYLWIESGSIELKQEQYG